jgi:hypothetical protein
LQEKAPRRSSGCKSPQGHPIPLIPRSCRSTGISVTKHNDGPALWDGAGYRRHGLGAAGYMPGLDASLRAVARPVLSLSAVTGGRDRGGRPGPPVPRDSARSRRRQSRHRRLYGSLCKCKRNYISPSSTILCGDRPF